MINSECEWTKSQLLQTGLSMSLDFWWDIPTLCIRMSTRTVLEQWKILFEIIPKPLINSNILVIMTTSCTAPEKTEQSEIKDNRNDSLTWEEEENWIISFHVGKKKLVFSI